MIFHLEGKSLMSTVMPLAGNHLCCPIWLTNNRRGAWARLCSTDQVQGHLSQFPPRRSRTSELGIHGPAYGSTSLSWPSTDPWKGLPRQGIRYWIP